MNKPNFHLLSMVDLSRIAHNEGEDITIRRSALEYLNKRERRLFNRFSYYSASYPATNYVPGL